MSFLIRRLGLFLLVSCFLASCAHGPETQTTRVPKVPAQTPLGRYLNQVYNAVGSLWYANVTRDKKLITPGRVVAVFLITPKGTIESLRVLSNTGNHKLETTCVRSIADAKFPPIPEEVVKTLPNGRLEFPFTFTFN